MSMARERVRGQMHARQLAHDRAYRVRTGLGCFGVSCLSRLAVDSSGALTALVHYLIHVGRLHGSAASAHLVSMHNRTNVRRGQAPSPAPPAMSLPALLGSTCAAVAGRREVVANGYQELRYCSAVTLRDCSSVIRNKRYLPCMHI